MLKGRLKHKKEKRMAKAKGDQALRAFILFVVWDDRQLNEATRDDAQMLDYDENSGSAAKAAARLGGVVFEHSATSVGTSCKLDVGVFRADLSPPPHGTWNARDVPAKEKANAAKRTESDLSSRNRGTSKPSRGKLDNKTRKLRGTNRANDAWSDL